MVGVVLAAGRVLRGVLGLTGRGRIAAIVGVALGCAYLVMAVGRASAAGYGPHNGPHGDGHPLAHAVVSVALGCVLFSVVFSLGCAFAIALDGALYCLGLLRGYGGFTLLRAARQRGGLGGLADRGAGLPGRADDGVASGSGRLVGRGA
jgi:hypothetical protein